MQTRESVLVLDFGSQTSHLIARRVREAEVYSRVVSHQITAEEVRDSGARGLILSGGPRSVYEAGAPRPDPAIFDLDLPILGICYGMQVGCEILGGGVGPAESREYGRTECSVVDASDLFAGFGDREVVWMSHGDQIADLSGDFVGLAASENCPHVAVRHCRQPFYGLQFHPEVSHTPRGPEIFANFLRRVCGCEGGWKMTSFLREAVDDVQQQVGSGRVVCGLSGGVDSAVTAALIHRAIGDRLECIFVDNGLLRAGESDEVVSTFGDLIGVPLHHVPAQERFLDALAGIADPEGTTSPASPSSSRSTRRASPTHRPRPPSSRAPIWPARWGSNASGSRTRPFTPEGASGTGR